MTSTTDTRRVRHDVADGLALMALSLALSCTLALVIALALALA